MRVLSLYDGISCGMAALERAGIPVESYDAFEIDKYAVKISEKNYPQIVHHGDVFGGSYSDFKGYDHLPAPIGVLRKQAGRSLPTVWEESFLWNMSEPCVKAAVNTFCMKTTTAYTKI